MSDSDVSEKSLVALFVVHHTRRHLICPSKSGVFFLCEHFPLSFSSFQLSAGDISLSIDGSVHSIGLSLRWRGRLRSDHRRARRPVRRRPRTLFVHWSFRSVLVADWSILQATWRCRVLPTSTNVSPWTCVCICSDSATVTTTVPMDLTKALFARVIGNL